jgi:1,4-dihydroxy-6-naphthoate synthase
MQKEYLVAHSPDADDIFMYYAIKFGWVGAQNKKFSNISADIETLNQAMLSGEYLIGAISFGLYPKIHSDYALLRCAGSFGNGYGPKLIKKKSKSLKRNFKVALSGENTTNALLFRLKYPEARVVYKNFMDIEDAVLKDEVDAGVLIHESILEFDDSLEVEAELWDIWLDMAKKELPLPLGGMAISRSLPLLDAIEIESVLSRAVEVANKNKEMLNKMIYERGLFRVDEEKLQKYLSMYADENSISFNDRALEGIDRLFEIGYEGGVFKELVKAEDMLIPKEYVEARF